ncbi:MAG: S41 family peptidase [Flavobacteriaceae bacterium]|nr:S41 family peptidase [Flavobacteriaceae bacterium]
MKNPIYGIWLITSIFLLASCQSVEKYNAHLEKEIPAELLKKDVDFTFEKLKKFHPKLDWYIQEDSLAYKFDSLKNTLESPLTPREFFTKIAPVVSEVRQGHLRVGAPMKRFTRKEIINLKNQKGLFGRMEYALYDDKLFVIENREGFAGIEPGTEILSIDGENTSKILERYKKLNSGDGYNTTFQRHFLAKAWPGYHVAENGILDSVFIETAWQNQKKSFFIHREAKSSDEKKEEKEKTKEMSSKENKTKDYNPQTLDYNRNLIFKDADSLVAYMKINTFSGIFSKKFYKDSFKLLKATESKYLILDIRNNLGGSLSEIQNLYSYLAQDEFIFLNDLEVTSKNSMMYARYFKGTPWWSKPFLGLFAPYYFVRTLTSTRKKGEKYVVGSRKYTRNTEPKADAFQGKIYVLINGSSFSAASVLPSKLKNEKRAILVGEETGGANDGTVAGRYTLQKMPESQLMIPIGLMLIQPQILYENKGLGVQPDVEIIPNIQNILQKDDVELNWVLDDIMKETKIELNNNSPLI